MKKAAALALATGAVGANAKVYFEEKFADGEKYSDRWTMSTWKDEQMGKFTISTGKYSGESDEAKKSAEGLMTSEDHRFYGATASFDKFSNEGKDLIIQYQVKYEEEIGCGGGYIKIGPTQDKEALEKFGDPTPYNIMFGPDKCGYQSRTHLIFNAGEGKNILKTQDLPYKQGKPGISTFYRLALFQNNTAQVMVDGSEIYRGSLEEDWKLLSAREISDKDDKKPEDWVDDEMMDDPEDKKPEDWVDEEEITDPEATKPDDWDTEEDGEWEAPKIKNPKFKGAWKAKKIDNPAYKGVWAPKNIANPEYEGEERASSLYKFEDFGFIGIDLWQVKSGALFDNILITDELEKADELKAEWKKQNEAEVEAKEAFMKTSTTTTTTTAASSKDDDDIDIDADDDKDDDKDDL